MGCIISSATNNSLKAFAKKGMVLTEAQMQALKHKKIMRLPAVKSKLPT
jgi:hypothetical protein